MKELGQYPAILTSTLSNNRYLKFQITLNKQKFDTFKDDCGNVFKQVVTTSSKQLGNQLGAKFLDLYDISPNKNLEHNYDMVVKEMCESINAEIDKTYTWTQLDLLEYSWGVYWKWNFIL